MTNVTVAIPPFPSQDLAKLVLGYLAEEQLMTAYDEFLQASPYLDALRNEYDRIFMTSLKSILAEYRAVKIYVETCRPFILRRKLFQCTNLLEIVKFLVSNVDINKVYVQEGSVDKVGKRRHHSSSKSNLCEVCTSLKLPNCVCKASNESTVQTETSSLESSVATTSLADLPGNTPYTKKVAKVLETGNKFSHSITSSDQIKDDSGNHAQSSEVLCSTNLEISDRVNNVISSATEKNYSSISNVMAKGHDAHSRQVVQDLSDVLSLVSHNRNDHLCKHKDITDAENMSCKKMSAVGNVQKLSTGVDSSSIHKVIVPDSSTPENNVTQASTTQTESIMDSTNIKKKNSRSKYAMKVSNEHNSLSLQSPSTIQSLPRITIKESLAKSTERKTEDQYSPKITIISDVKVDNDIKMPAILKNATPTPVVKMQTVFINGTPAYKQTSQIQKNYTQDEIMAMPTIILVPAGTSKKTVPIVTQNNMIDKIQRPPCTVASSSIDQTLGPLVIDVSTADTASIDNGIIESCPQNTQKHLNNNRILNTVEANSHMSLPKDASLSALKTSTPHVLPPTRKSSSTPRRTSHIRVLDFTTPRRILHESENEQGGNNIEGTNVCASDEAADSEPTVPLIDNINVDTTVSKTSSISSNVISSGNDNGSAKENKTTTKSRNWDAELRALVHVGNGNIEKSQTSLTKSKKSKRKSSKSSDKCVDTRDSVKKATEKKKSTSKNRSTKIRKKSFEITNDEPGEAQDKATVSTISVKPTINIICRNKWSEPTDNISEKIQTKPHNSDEPIATPELERMSLQNEIGAKLNISDLLETPYKQALYDIQMETPKFSGPDILDDPLSDIKIMNIPTPRFLNTPKLTQNTPTSYSSRPTDYSSGGSYYKPDDQDYVIATEVMECALTASIKTSKKNNILNSHEGDNISDEKIFEGKSRPVRQCTKNVSYNYSSPMMSHKTKDLDEDKIEKSSICSETNSNKIDKKIDKPKISKSDKDTKKEKRSETKKKINKCEISTKKDAKVYMKIKPRIRTPIKEVFIKGRKKTADYSQAVCTKSQSKRIMSGKNRNYSPVLVPVSTKSRRKSSTPRKLNCSKIYNSESPVVSFPDRSKQSSVSNLSRVKNSNVYCSPDSDIDQLSLRWSDDGSQELEHKTNDESTHAANESDDINKIREYISTIIPNEVQNATEAECTLQVDLIRRGFDVATARMIERDLLETPERNTPNEEPIENISEPASSITSHTKIIEPEGTKCDKSVECAFIAINDSKNTQDVDDIGDFDLSVHETNEETNNYLVYKFNEDKFMPTETIKLKETFSMEICIEDDVAIRLRATPFKTVFEQGLLHDKVQDCNPKPVEKLASPHDYDNLYTPRKAQCYEIFDSTLTSLDTPLKPNSPKAQDMNMVAEIVLEVEKLETDIKQKPEGKKRKRLPSGTSDESSYGIKKAKPDAPYLLNSASIQNIDIESVLSKLHGP